MAQSPVRGALGERPAGDDAVVHVVGVRDRVVHGAGGAVDVDFLAAGDDGAPERMSVDVVGAKLRRAVGEDYLHR